MTKMVGRLSAASPSLTRQTEASRVSRNERKEGMANILDDKWPAGKIRPGMHHYIAFLRGMNLGKRRLEMAELRSHFEKLKFADVTTFIASGNVIFASKIADSRKLEKLIQDHLAKSLGYEVDTFLRTRAEVAAVAAFRPFAKADMENPAHTVFAGFLKEALSPELTRKFVACRTAVDEFRVEDQEYYWLCRIKSNESTVWSLKTMRALKLPTSSMRNLTTVRKLAALYPVATA